MNDPKLIEALSNASNLELFQLSAVIDRMLQDPRRILAVRSKLHLGQTVRFVDWRDAQMRSGRIVMLKDTQAIIHDLHERKEWKLPYAAIEPPAGPSQPVQPAESAERVQAVKPGRNDFRCGERVSFQDRYLQNQIGTIVRINQRTATVDCGTESWRVPFAALRHVLDV